MSDARDDDRMTEPGAGAPENEHAMEAEADLEARMATLAERVVELEGELGAARSTIESRDRESSIAEAVEASGAIEAEAVRALVERAMHAEPDLSASEALDAVRDRKPVLFSGPSARGTVMGEAMRGSGVSGLAAARDAAAEGDRASLLRYLRLRREQG